MASKEMTQAVGAKLMTDYSQFIPSTTAALAARLYTNLGMANRTNPVFNCVITNVPGPQVPLYCAGAKMVAQYGLGPVFDGMGLIFPVVSYCGRLTISATSCREMLPDPEFFAECIQQSYDDLKAATLGKMSTGRSPRRLGDAHGTPTRSDHRRFRRHRRRVRAAFSRRTATTWSSSRAARTV